MSDHSYLIQHKMRRGDRALSRSRAYAILEEGNYGVLSTASREGEPYGVSLNYCVMDEEIAFHCAREDRKIEHLHLNSRLQMLAHSEAVIEIPEGIEQIDAGETVQADVLI